MSTAFHSWTTMISEAAATLGSAKHFQSFSFFSVDGRGGAKSTEVTTRQGQADAY